MRKLKLQMQLSVDGFVCGEQGEMDWLTWDWDDALKNYVTDLTAPCDLLVMGHGLAKGFIPHWQGLAEQADAAEFEKKMANIQKTVFSNSPGDLRKDLERLNWKHTSIGGENLVEEVIALKKQSGGDIICYGGADFVGSLAAANLIDEYHLFINPAAIGKGLRIFHKLGKSLPLQASAATKFDCGIMVLTYRKS
jgi:dihydrofolate reductase